MAGRITKELICPEPFDSAQDRRSEGPVLKIDLPEGSGG